MLALAGGTGAAKTASPAGCSRGSHSVAPPLTVDSSQRFGSFNWPLWTSVARSNKVPSRHMRRVVLAAAAAHALQHAQRRHRSLIVASSSKRSVSDLIGNQHGGKYNFDGSYVEGASAGADYGRRRKATVPADEAWAEPTLELVRGAASIDAIRRWDAIAEMRRPASQVANDEMAGGGRLQSARGLRRVAGADRIGTSPGSRDNDPARRARRDRRPGGRRRRVRGSDGGRPRVWPPESLIASA